jgi:acetyl-CoA acyltransferase
LNPRDAVIVAGVRTPVGRGVKGSLREVRPDEMAAHVLKELLARTPSFPVAELDDVVLGCAFPEAEQGMNVARIATLRAGLPSAIPAMTVNRFCSSGLQSIAMAAAAIREGTIDAAVAGGTESMSLIPMGGHKMTPNPTIMRTHPDIYLNMGLTAENLAEKYGISREEQDAFALESHRKAVQAQGEGRFVDEIVPLAPLRADECPRPDTSTEALAGLRPVFHARGTVTAGNSSPNSDGAAAVLILSREKAAKLGLRPRLTYLGFAVSGVEPEIMGIGPVQAVPRLLRRFDLRLEDVDLYELNEAFAAQALAVLRELPIPAERLNVNGGAIAIGHPLGATGARLTVTLMNEMARRDARYGVVTMCVGGGMGAAGLFRRE